VSRQDGDHDGRVLRPLALVDRRGIGRHQRVEPTEAVGDGPAVETDGDTPPLRPLSPLPAAILLACAWHRLVMCAWAKPRRRRKTSARSSRRWRGMWTVWSCSPKSAHSSLNVSIGLRRAGLRPSSLRFVTIALVPSATFPGLLTAPA
jgi:hypothetical protein